MITRASFTVSICLLLMLLAAGRLPAQEAGEEAAAWQPQSPVSGASIEDDWVQLNREEWVKGEFISLRNDVLEFESDEFGVQSFDWDKVTEFHTSGRVIIVFFNRETVVSRLSIIRDTVQLHNDDAQVSRRGIVSIIPARSTWWELWSGRASVGLNFRTGNTNQGDLQIGMRLTNRMAFHRINLAYLGNWSRAEGVTLATDNEASISWNYFLNYRVFLIPVSYSFYGNPFRNIAQQHDASVGVGLEILDLNAVEWDISGGAGYQYTQYSSVESGQDPDIQSVILRLGTKFSADITKTTEVFLSHSVDLDTLRISNLVMDMRLLLDVDITDNLGLEVNFTWDYIGDPEPRADGSVPVNNDFGLNIGIGWEF